MPSRHADVPPDRSVRLVTLGCARNEVDSEELAGRLEAAGWRLDSGEGASVVLVNTCGFIDAAKQESIAEILDASSSSSHVVAAGCLAERYGDELARELPEAQVLSFDDYGDIAGRLDEVLAGGRWEAHRPRDRRLLLPLAPAERAGRVHAHVPGHGMTTAASPVAASPDTAAAPVVAPPDLPSGSAPVSGPRPVRRRLGGGPAAPLKIASGCDRRCSFCAIPAFRGAFLSRPPAEIVAEAQWLAAHGVREVLLVSENSTSYGKDLGNLSLLDELLPQLAAVPGIARVRVSYLQPAEMRPGLITVMTGTEGVAPYFDLSFQHASGSVLRAMRRFGDTERFCDLLETVRQACPQAGVRSNFIVGFPGESAADLAELERFLSLSRLDAIGIFGYSDEDGTQAASLAGHVDPADIARRVGDLSDIAEEVMAQRAADRVGETVSVLIEEALIEEGSGGGHYLGRAEHQAPEVDGVTTVRSRSPLAVGDIVSARVVSSDGADLTGEVLLGDGDGPVPGSGAVAGSAIR